MTEPSADFRMRSSAPLDSLVLILPLLLVYELGMLLIGPAAMRNGADSWLRFCLEQVGFGQYFLLPLLTCGLLLAYHHLGLHRWRVDGHAIGDMLIESAAFAVVLLVLATAIGSVAVRCELPQHATAVRQADHVRLLSSLGAGVYEELVFRLMLIPAIAVALQRIGEPVRSSWVTAAIASSFLFSAAHYSCLTGSGDALIVSTFLFRFLAGLSFSALFVTRGFGTAVCTHALYDCVLVLTA